MKRLAGIFLCHKTSEPFFWDASPFLLAFYPSNFHKTRKQTTILKNDYKGMEVKCKTNDTLELSQLVEFQGNLKERTDGDFEKIAKSIKKHGFAFPFFVWKHDGINHVLDGHGRIGALKRIL